MRYLPTLCLFLFQFTACNPVNQEDNSLANDTIQTASGLRYFYLNKGEGRRVESGSKVTAKLSLRVGDSTVWTSYDSPDSTFSHIAGSDMVISGYEEMALLMREGDNVVAILPDSLAYGDEGAGEGLIPPYATLVYDRFEVVKVTKPKGLAIDTLYAVYMQEGIQAFKERHLELIDDSSAYHIWGEYDNLRLMRKFYRDSLHQAIVEVAGYLGRHHRDPEILAEVAFALERDKKIHQAIDTLQKIMKQFPDSLYDGNRWEEEIVRLQALLQK